MIVYLLIGIILIIWLQYPDINENQEDPLYKRIFERIKIPMVFICIVIIISLLSSTKVLESATEQKVYMSVPEF